MLNLLMLIMGNKPLQQIPSTHRNVLIHAILVNAECILTLHYKTIISSGVYQSAGHFQELLDMFN